MQTHSSHPVIEAGPLIERFGVAFIVVALGVIFFWFGGMKFTAYEAQGIASFVEPSPILSWVYALFSVQTFSNLLGVLEISIGAMILAHFVNPRISALGGFLAAGLFLTTLSFMLSTPGIAEATAGGFPAISVAPGQFLLKDIGLLAASIFILGRSLVEMGMRARADSDNRMNVRYLP